MPPATRSVPGSAFKALQVFRWCFGASEASALPDDADRSGLSDYSDSSEWLGPPERHFRTLAPASPSETGWREHAAALGRDHPQEAVQGEAPAEFRGHRAVRRGGAAILTEVPGRSPGAPTHPGMRSEGTLSPFTPHDRRLGTAPGAGPARGPGGVAGLPPQGEEGETAQRARRGEGLRSSPAL